MEKVGSQGVPLSEKTSFIKAKMKCAVPQCVAAICVETLD